jgi:hypothetical protein
MGRDLERQAIFRNARGGSAFVAQLLAPVEAGSPRPGGGVSVETLRGVVCQAQRPGFPAFLSLTGMPPGDPKGSLAARQGQGVVEKIWAQVRS